MIKLYTCPGTRGMRATWALEEVGADYQLELVDLGSGAARKPPYIGINPGGKVPTLVDGEMVLTESAAICTYLGDRFPAAGLVPEPGSDARAHYLRWCFFVIGELEQPLWTLAKHRFALPEKYQVPAVTDTAKWEFSVAARVLAAGLGDREYLVGERFTAADVLAGHTLAWARRAKLPLADERLEAYADRVLGRRALVRAREREEAARVAQAT